MARGEVRQPELSIVRRAAQVVRAGSIVGSSSAGGSSRPPAVTVTRSGVDDDGNVVTVHDFMLGVDALGDPTAELRVAGNTIDYLNF